MFTKTENYKTHPTVQKRGSNYSNIHFLSLVFYSALKEKSKQIKSKLIMQSFHIKSSIDVSIKERSYDFYKSLHDCKK